MLTVEQRKSNSETSSFLVVAKLPALLLALQQQAVNFIQCSMTKASTPESMKARKTKCTQQ